MPDTLMTQIIEDIFDVLPAKTYYDIAKKLRTKGWNVGCGVVSNALTTLRRNPAEYGYTVPHIKRGMARRYERNEDRLICILVDRDGHYELDSNPLARKHINAGAIATAQHAATMLSNEAKALELAATNTRSINARARIKDLADDFGYVARKAVAVVRDLKDNRAA